MAPLVGRLLDDAEVEEAFARLDAVRKERAHGDDDDVDTPDWKVTVLGGAWTAAHRGVAFDAIRASVRAGSDAEAFAVAYQLGKSARFDISLYGCGAANQLAKAFCHKCQWAFLLWESSGDKNYVFSNSDKEAYIEPAFFPGLLETLEGRARARAQGVRDLWPATFEHA